MCHLLDLLGRILRAAVIASLRLETHDLFALVDVLLKLTRLRLELLILTELVLDLLPELLLCLVEGLDALLHILIKLSDLVLETLLVFLILLLMLALDDLLSLLGDPVHLNILCTLLEIQDLKVKLLLLIVNLAEERLELRDLLHLLDLLVASLHDLFVLHFDYTTLDKDCILVIGGDG